MKLPKWIPIYRRAPKRADADRLGNVWAIAQGNTHTYPCEAFYKHVQRWAKLKKNKRFQLFTHWASPPVKTWEWPEEREARLAKEKK